MSPSTVPAMLYEGHAAASLPLLKQEPSSTSQAAPKRHFSLGFSVGTAVQLCALFVNNMFLVVMEKEHVLESVSFPMSLVLLVVWSVMATLSALTVLRCIQAKVYPPTDTQTDGSPALDFFDGALVGACTTLVVMDLAQGRGTQIVWSVAALSAALVWCRVSKLLFPMTSMNETAEIETFIV